MVEELAAVEAEAEVAEADVEVVAEAASAKEVTTAVAMSASAKEATMAEGESLATYVLVSSSSTYVGGVFAKKTYVRGGLRGFGRGR